MADNYLEKRMDDYRRGSSTAKSRTTLKVLTRTVLIADTGSDATTEVARLLVRLGCKVCICGADAAAIAQATGGRFYPYDIEKSIADMASRGESVDAMIFFDPAALLLVPDGAMAICLGRTDISEAVCISLPHPTATAWATAGAIGARLRPQNIG